MISRRQCKNIQQILLPLKSEVRITGGWVLYIELQNDPLHCPLGILPDRLVIHRCFLLNSVAQMTILIRNQIQHADKYRGVSSVLIWKRWFKLMWHDNLMIEIGSNFSVGFKYRNYWGVFIIWIIVYRMEFDETKWSGSPKSDQKLYTKLCWVVVVGLGCQH